MLQKVVFFMICSVILLLGACVSTTEDTDDAKNMETHYQPIHQINSTKVFASDDKNANYIDEKGDDEKSADVSVSAKQEMNDKTKISGNKNMAIIIEDQLPNIRNMESMILFDNGSSEVNNKYVTELKEAAKKAKEKKAKILVYGYASGKTRNTDLETQKNINFKMSLKRAQSVAAVLEKAGVKKESIVVKAFADTMPMLNDKMIEGERFNRRAEVYLVY